jgi:hypothetical protein
MKQMQNVGLTKAEADFIRQGVQVAQTLWAKIRRSCNCIVSCLISRNALAGRMLSEEERRVFLQPAP